MQTAAVTGIRQTVAFHFPQQLALPQVTPYLHVFFAVTDVAPR